MSERLTPEELQELFDDHRSLHLMDSARIVAEIKALTEERDAARQDTALEAYNLFAKQIMEPSSEPQLNLLSGIMKSAAGLIAKHFKLDVAIAKISEGGK